MLKFELAGGREEIIFVASASVSAGEATSWKNQYDSTTARLKILMGEGEGANTDTEPFIFGRGDKHN